MRLLQCGAGFLVAAYASGQSSSPAAAPSPPQRLEAIIQCQRDSIGANLVKVSVLDPKYSLATLQDQIAELGKLAGSGARGIQVNEAPIDPKDPSSRLVRVTFAVDGIIERGGEWVKIAPIVQAFAGTTKAPGFSDFQIDFDFERPTAKDLNTFSSSEVDIVRREVSANGFDPVRHETDRSLEYQVLVKKLGTNPIVLPDFAPAPNKQTTSSVPQTKTDWLIVVTVGVAIAAVGALVYCLFLLKPSQRGPRR
jgi:hypothetical protein